MVIDRQDPLICILHMSTYFYGEMSSISVYIYIYIIEGSLEVKLPTIWTVEKQR